MPRPRTAEELLAYMQSGALNLRPPSRVDCPTCVNFAWHGAYQQSVKAGGHTHHPGCPRLARNASQPRAGQVFTATAARVARRR